MEIIGDIAFQELFARFNAVKNTEYFLAAQPDMQGKTPQEIHAAATDAVREMIDMGYTLLPNGTLFYDQRQWY